jgi:hypothetical protein
MLGQVQSSFLRENESLVGSKPGDLWPRCEIRKDAGAAESAARPKSAVLTKESNEKFPQIQ